VLALQFVALIGTAIAGVWQISRGQAIEPSAMVTRVATAIGERIARS